MKTITKVFSRKTRRGKIARLVREQYLRSDIECEMSGCTICQHQIAKLFPEETTHFLIPDMHFILNFIEMLESASISELIFLETITAEVIRLTTTGMY